MEHRSSINGLREERPVEPSVPDSQPGVMIKREQIINALNRINFHNGRVFVTLKHQRFNSFINVAAQPQPCRDEFLELLWSSQAEEEEGQLNNYKYLEFFYTDGLKQVRVAAELLEVGQKGLFLRLPETGIDSNHRQCRRFGCYEAIRAQVVQSGLALQGWLADFNGYAFAVNLGGVDPEDLRLLNPESPVNVLLREGEDVLLAETCRIIRLDRDHQGETLVLAPQSSQISRFKSKEMRSVRQHLHPQPSIEFNHPLFPRRVSLRAVDISGSGLAVEEEPAHSLLMPGMVIPKAAISFSQNFKIDCRVQVLFNRLDEEKKTLKCGLVFLDMDFSGQMQLSSMLYQTQNEHSYLGTVVDLDELWNFFFDTGFIYPAKYSSIQEQRENFKKLYSRLYNESSEISRHIVYQDRGMILGHVSMFRYYDQTWILQHHAAVKSNHHKAGLVVMDHILRHINEVHQLSSNRMRYIACYFRPSNRFAAKVFGGSVRALDNPRHCSLDEFAYFHHHGCGGSLPPDWRLEESVVDDLYTLEYFYREMSGGLLLEALDLYPGAWDREAAINEDYRRLVLRRDRRFFSLRRPEGGLVALLVVNISDIGLNLSDLTNGVQVMVIDDREFSAQLLYAALHKLAGCFERPDFSVLLFPLSCAVAKKIPYDKVYQLGILDLNHISEYLKFIESLMGSSLRLQTPHANG